MMMVQTDQAMVAMSSMRKRIAGTALCALIALNLCACASAEELRARDVEACKSYGFKPETPDFSQCLERENLARAYAATPQVGLGVGFGFGGW
jgi:hypothetical protein